MKKYRKIFLFGILPALFYLAFFVFYTWPWTTHFSSAFFADTGDGLQNVWNLWWVNFAVQHQQNIYFTNFLHFPGGTTLLAQTLNPINGIFAVILLKFFSLVQSYNLIVILAFVLTGLFTFWLAWEFSRSYIGGLLAGFALTFSSYHFAHAIGHLNLITLEFIPLFLLCFWRLLKKPTIPLAIFSAVTLFLVEFSDLYYLIFCLIVAGIIIIYLLVLRRLLWSNFAQKNYAIFVGLSALIVAPLSLLIFFANWRDTFLGVHKALEFSLDLPAAIIPGQIWHFAALTASYWTKNPLGIVEGSVSVGIIIWLAVLAAIFAYKKFRGSDLALWLWIFFIFGILSFGPRLQIGGKIVSDIPLPYSLATRILPFLNLGGTPVRMMVISMLAGSLVLAIVVGKIQTKKISGKIILFLIFALMFVELWPAKLPLTKAAAPDFVQKLAELPAGAVVDLLDTPTSALYFQTIYQKPLVGGYISRLPTSVSEKDAAIFNLIDEKNYSALRNQYQIRYLIFPAVTDSSGLPSPIYRDQTAAIYDLDR
ncbi:MAG: hypothetical protein NTW79_02685 [Candidatus Berkelbacteria bacterium]|nr:hypothetical protein [Candidatus Berkelbacteria bacterium]